MKLPKYAYPHTLILTHTLSFSLSLTPRGSAASRDIRTASSARALTAVRTLHSRAEAVRERERGGIEFYFVNSAARESQRLVKNVSIHSYFVTS